MKRQRKSCRKGCSQAALSTSGLSSGLSITTVCSPATVHTMLNSGYRASGWLLYDQWRLSIYRLPTHCL